MNAQGRGHAGDIDPADQWVFDPNTGSYELRLSPSAGDSPSRPGSSRPTAPRQRRSPEDPSSTVPIATRSNTRTSAGGGSDPTAEDETPLPPQRRRRSRAAAASGAASAAGASTAAAGGGRRAGSGTGGRGRRKTQPAGGKGGTSVKQKVLRWGGGTLGLILIAGCAGGYYLYERLDGNINKLDVGMNSDAVTDGPVNILVIGTDARDGKGNTGYGDKGSVGHADTTLLFHVSEDRSNATVLSIPRDMITDIPDCPTKQPDGTTEVVPGEQGVRFNTSLGQRDRDPGCTGRTVKALTGLKVDHFMMADFNAVKELSTAVGGVEVCAAKDINDPKSHLNLEAGRHVLKGEQALAFVRTRHAVGTGSDLSRIELQQQFLSSMLRKMQSSDTLTSPSKLFNLAEAATKALTVDQGIGSVKKLMDLANDLKRVDTGKITFATVPVVDNPQDPATVVLDEAKARPLFRMVQQDKSLSAAKKEKKKKEKAAAEAAKVPAAEVSVNVSNGGGPPRAAQETVDWLQTQGVTDSANQGNAPQQLERTRLEFRPEQAGAAATLADLLKLPKSALKETSDVSGTGMNLTLGADFTGPGESMEAPDKTPEGVQNVNADNKNICAK